MAGIGFVFGKTAERVPGYLAPHCQAEGEATSRNLGPEDFPLFLVGADLAGGTRLVFGADHGDEVLYVQEGGLDVDGHSCPPGGAVVLEAGAEATLSAAGATSVLHFGPLDTAAPTDVANGAGGHGVHVVGPGGTYAAEGPGRLTKFFADSTCPSCRVTLMYTGRSERYESAPHSHSQDELIHLLEGEIVLGSYRLGPGDTLAVAADRRYRFNSGDSGFGFLNYRRGPSVQTIDPAAPPRIEGGAANGFELVNDLR